MLKQIPSSERPMEKLIEFGAENLSDAELLANIFRTGSGKESALEVSRKLLEYCNQDVSRLSNLSLDEMCLVDGIGKVKAVKLKSAFEISKRALRGEIKRTKLTSPEAVANYFSTSLADEVVEKVVVVLLNTKKEIIDWKIISTGIINSSIVHPREVFNFAIKNMASSIIVVHNHPSGYVEPSHSDDQITKTLSNSGKIIGIDFVDHIIVGKNGFYSYAKEGKL